jgi:hypothetical protein
MVENHVQNSSFCHYIHVHVWWTLKQNQTHILWWDSSDHAVKTLDLTTQHPQDGVWCSQTAVRWDNDLHTMGSKMIHEVQYRLLFTHFYAWFVNYSPRSHMTRWPMNSAGWRILLIMLGKSAVDNVQRDDVWTTQQDRIFMMLSRYINCWQLCSRFGNTELLNRIVYLWCSVDNCYSQCSWFNVNTSAWLHHYDAQ